MTRMTMPLSLAFILCLALPMAACDQPAEDTAAVAPAQTQTQAGDDTLPAATPDAQAESVADESSMAEDSPAGEGVTAEEIPHSDVPPPSREVFTDAECDFESWVGKPVDEAAAKETGRPYRILAPDSMMTMDHNPERVNVVHDGEGKVTRVWCG